MRIAAAFLLAGLGAGCAGPDYSGWYARAAALRAAETVISFELTDSSGLSPSQKQQRESQVLVRLEERCAKPIYGAFDAVVADAVASIPRVGEMLAFNSLVMPAERADRELASCFAREGAVGGVFMNVDGRDMANEEFVRAMLSLATTRPGSERDLALWGGGCGSRGGPGWRKGNGQCASWRD